MKLPLLVVLGCAAMVAACGGTSSSNKSATNARDFAQAVRFASCIRAHGVPNFPDPVGGGFSFPTGAGFNPGAPAFRAAQHACHSLAPPGATSPPQASAQQKAQALQLATCMRAHGVTGFPDPLSSPPSNSAAYSIVFGQPGAITAVPSTIAVQSPVFKTAARVCNFPGGGPKRG